MSPHRDKHPCYHLPLSSIVLECLSHLLHFIVNAAVNNKCKKLYASCCLAPECRQMIRTCRNDYVLITDKRTQSFRWWYLSCVCVSKQCALYLLFYFLLWGFFIQENVCGCRSLRQSKVICEKLEDIPGRISDVSSSRTTCGVREILV